MPYIAATLLYLKDPIEVTDADSGLPITRERGYVEPGQPVDLPDDDPRLEIWRDMGAIAVAPIQSEPASEPPAEPPPEPKQHRRLRAPEPQE